MYRNMCSFHSTNDDTNYFVIFLSGEVGVLHGGSGVSLGFKEIDLITMIDLRIDPLSILPLVIKIT